MRHPLAKRSEQVKTFGNRYNRFMNCLNKTSHDQSKRILARDVALTILRGFWINSW